MFSSHDAVIRTARIGLFIVMMAAVAFTAGSVLAQASTGSTAEQAQPEGLTHLILGHIDGIFITIGVLSITGLTLIIQAFIKNRASVFMPEATTNLIREMISQRKFKELIDFLKPMTVLYQSEPGS